MRPYEKPCPCKGEQCSPAITEQLYIAEHGRQGLLHRAVPSTGHIHEAKRGVALKKADIRWVFRVVTWSVVLAILFTFLSSAVLEEAGYILAFGVLLTLIIVGILFDMIGVAVTAGDETPFHSMAAHRGWGGKEAIRLIKNADRVASFCNDVVGDITGIISGTTMAAIALRLTRDFSLSSLMVNLIISAVVIGLTIGGKALGKMVAIRDSDRIVLFVARIICRKNWVMGKILRRSAR